MRLIQSLPFLGFALSVNAVRRDALHKTGIVMDAPVRRQVDVVSGVFNKISTDTQALDTAIKGFKGDASALTGASNTLLNDIKSGTTTVKNSQPLDIAGATGIVTSVTGLNGTVATTITDLISAKGAIVSAGQGGTVYQSLVDQKSASQALADAVTAKAPTGLQSVSQSLSAGIISSLQRGIDAYQDQQGSTAPSGGSSSAPASKASSSAVAPTSAIAPVSSSVATGTSTVAAPVTSAMSPTTSGSGSYGGSYSTTAASGPATFTGAAMAQSPMIGLAVAAVGLVAAF